ncbi:hypothetical protein [Paraglaciecola sp.]|uniref:hypothetical protein n=1 Tax=Paraglaciecola sp. TaxID=1920173 RepID=UPI0030F43EA2
MSALITANKHVTIPSNTLSIVQKTKDANSPAFPSTVQGVSANNANTSIDNIRYSQNISSINSADVKEVFEQIKQEAKEKLEANNFENKVLKSFDYINASIDEIINHPIEVKIEKDEIYTAILYSRMGIDFLDVKRIEFRMELLKLAQDDVVKLAKSGLIRKDQETTLVNKIEGHNSQLLEEKKRLLEGTQRQENEQMMLEKLKFRGSVAATSTSK